MDDMQDQQKGSNENNFSIIKKQEDKHYEERINKVRVLIGTLMISMMLCAPAALYAEEVTGPTIGIQMGNTRLGECMKGMINKRLAEMPELSNLHEKSVKSACKDGASITNKKMSECSGGISQIYYQSMQKSSAR